jgi:hypothetical protein
MKPKKFKLFHPDDIGQYTQLTLRDVEKVNPLEYFSAQFIRASIVAERDKLVHQGFPLSEELITETLLAKASLEWDQKLKTLLALPTPDVIVDTLNEKKSSSQEAILKNLTLSNDHIIAFILNAGKKGFVFSQYRVEKPIQDPKPQFSYATKVFTAKFLDKKMRGSVSSLPMHAHQIHKLATAISQLFISVPRLAA